MVDPALYSQNHEITTVDGTYFFENYGKFLNWSCNENVLDVGIGDGGVTLDCLLPKIPKDFKKLIGVDNNKQMVEIASTKTRNSKIDFVVLDICTPVVPEDFQEKFHHIFGFYLLHWVQDQKTMFRNMYKMLKPGGELFVTCMVQLPVYDAEEIVAKKEKWKLLTANYKDYISVYKYSNNPVKDLKNYLENEGFICRLCQLDERVHTFRDYNVFKAIACSVNPFCQQLPEDKRDAYIHEFIAAYESSDNVKIYNAPNGKEKNVDLFYTTMVAIVSKPS